MVKRISRFFKDELILHTVIVFLGTSLTGFFNLVYHLVSVRLLSLEDYGTFNVLVSFVMFTSMAISPLRTALTRFFTEYIAKKEIAKLAATVRELTKRLLFFSVAIFFSLGFTSSVLARFLKTDPVYIVICGAIVALSLVSLLCPSVFQSFQKFKTYSFIGITSSLGKLLVGFVLMALGYGVLGGLSGFLVVPLLTIFVSFFFILNFWKTLDVSKTMLPFVSLVPIYKYFFPVSLILFSFTFLTSIDVLLVKHFFSPLETGYYSVAQMVGKIALFLPSALAIVIFPKSTKAYVSNECPLKFLYKSLYLAGSCCLVVVSVSFLFPEIVLKVLTGKANPVSSSLVGLFSVVMSFYALTWIVINFTIATHNLRLLLPFLLLAGLEAIAIYNCHPSLSMVVYILLFFGIVSLAMSLLVVKINSKSKV